jgi:hypothetical protein
VQSAWHLGGKKVSLSPPPPHLQKKKKRQEEEEGKQNPKELTARHPSQESKSKTPKNFEVVKFELGSSQIKLFILWRSHLLGLQLALAKLDSIGNKICGRGLWHMQHIHINFTWFYTLNCISKLFHLLYI